MAQITQNGKGEMTMSERKKWYQERKLSKKRKIRRESYHRCKERHDRKRNSTLSETKEALWKRKQRQRKKEKEESRRKSTLDRVHKYRAKQVNERFRNQSDTERDFKHKMQKSRSINKLRKSLPQTPKRRSAVLQAYLEYKSPTAKTVRKNMFYETPNLKPVIDDLKSAIKSLKMKRSNDARAAVNVICASVNGNSVQNSKSQKKVARILGLPIRRLYGGKAIRTRVLTSEKSSWTHTDRKTRSDSLSEQDKKLAYNFWLLPDNSRPTCNKRDVKRVRIGPKCYSSHMVSVLEKSQTDVYLDFKKAHPEIKMCQRTFERCKPFYVQPVRPRDRHTCLCRYHVEAKSAFKSCMNFRKSISENGQNEFPVYDHIDDLIKETLCDHSDGNVQMDCLNRNCTSCGVEFLKLQPEENDISDDAPKVQWNKYEYLEINGKKGKKIRKLTLVNKETKPGEMFSYLKEILATFPSHQFRATWQNSQLKHLQQNLPQNHCMCVHDFSENYYCFEKDEIQSNYFQKNEVSLHVSVIYRHSILEVDGVDSSDKHPNIITEHLFLISPDLNHDHNFSQYAQLQVAEYLRSINYECSVMHEFTDGCPCQYKSRHCMGGISVDKSTLGYDKVIRNYFETSHGKGAHDAAGGQIKNQADLAVRRGKIQIRSAKDLYNFAEEHLQVPKFSVNCKRRIFRFADSIPRDDNKLFKPIAGIRKIHQISTTNTHGELLTRQLSCYSCTNCTEHDADYRNCENKWLGNTAVVRVVRDGSRNPVALEEENENEVEMRDLITPGCIVAVYTDDKDKDYYMFQVKAEPEILTESVKDYWGAEFTEGQDIIRGLYYDNYTDNLFQYKLLRNKPAVIPTLSVRYILSTKTKDRICISEDEHLDILAALEQHEN